MKSQQLTDAINEVEAIAARIRALGLALVAINEPWTTCHLADASAILHKLAPQMAARRDELTDHGQ